jgi:hypothetical protein
MVFSQKFGQSYKKLKKNAKKEKFAKIIFFFKWKKQRKRKNKKPHIYFKYYNIIYLFLKFRKNYKKFGETVPSRVYRVVPNRVVHSRVPCRTVPYFVSCRTMYALLTMSCPIVEKSNKARLRHDMARVVVLTVSCHYRVVSFVPCSATVAWF